MKPTESAAPVSRPRALPALVGRKPGLPAAVVATAALVLGIGVVRALQEGHALFPTGTVGWALSGRPAFVLETLPSFFDRSLAVMSNAPRGSRP